MRSRRPAGVLALWLASSALAAVAPAQTRPPAPGEDFPLEDRPIWRFVEQGLKNRAADVQLAKAPESPETVALLLDAYRPGDALVVLRRIVESRPEQMGAAFKAASLNPRFDDEGRGHRSAVREIVARARERLRELPREQAAEAAWHLSFVDPGTPGVTYAPWRDRVRAFADEYEGTEAVLAAELQLLDAGDSEARVAGLEAFARRHAGTVIGAYALYTAAMRVEGVDSKKPGGDPTGRLLRVAALARELLTGAYPECDWVRQAPNLVFGIYTSAPRYSKENVPRVLAVFREFLVRNFQVPPVNPLGSGVGTLITSKLPEVFAAVGLEPVAEIDRLLLEVEKAVKEPAAVRYVRGLWYRHLADSAKDPGRGEWKRRSDATLLDLARSGTGLYNRKALATLASREFASKNCTVAIERYREYLSRFPLSEWAWVAGLRLGQCEQYRGNWAAARRAYESVTPGASVLPPALVLGHTFAGRASEALGDTDRAQAAYERAHRAWDPHFEAPYFATYQFYTRLDDEPCRACDPRSSADVSKEWLARRVEQLIQSSGTPGGALLERGRFFVTQAVWRNALNPLSEFIRRYPGSPHTTEARELLIRAKLELALARGGPDAGETGRRAALASLDALAAEPYGFSVFAAHVARATLHSLLGSESRAAELMSDALGRWHDHGAVFFAAQSAAALEQDVMDIRDAVFRPNANRRPQEFGRFGSVAPPPFFIAAPEVRVTLHDEAEVRVQAAARLSARPGALLLDEEQIAVLERILAALGGTKQRAARSIMETPNQPIGEVDRIQKFWNRFFTMGPGHWGGWILETFPIVTEVTFTDPARTRGAARIRVGYQGYTQLLTKADGAWKLSATTGHWIE